MKPRFSILTLLGITAYVAVNVAALQKPDSGWTIIVFYTWLAILAFASINAAQPSSPAAVFSRGFVFVALVYGASTFVYRMVTLGQPPLPHIYLTDFIHSLMTGDGRGPRFDPFAASPALALYLVPFHNVSLIFGLFGGSLALWRYRRLERRELQEKSH